MFDEFEKSVDLNKEWLRGEYMSLRTSRAAPALLDNIFVEAYGNKGPISHIASISTLDPRTLRVSPWDKSIISVIEGAIAASNLGVSAQSDAEGIRVSFPELTAERREMLAKVVREKLEEARIRIKKDRENVWNEISRMEKNKEISEDDKFRYKEELQKKVLEINKDLEKIAEDKVKELLE